MPLYLGRTDQPQAAAASRHLPHRECVNNNGPRRKKASSVEQGTQASAGSDTSVRSVQKLPTPILLSPGERDGVRA